MCSISSRTFVRGWRSLSSVLCRSSSLPSVTLSSSSRCYYGVARRSANSRRPVARTDSSYSWLPSAWPRPDCFLSVLCRASSYSSASRTGTSPKGKTRRTRFARIPNHVELLPLHSLRSTLYITCWDSCAPCGLRGCKNRPAPFPCRMS